MVNKKLMLSAFLLAVFSATSQAEGFYIGGSLSYNDQDDVHTDGTFNRDYLTGGPIDLLVPAGTSVNWQTDLDSGWGANFMLGWQMDSFRVELEYAYAENDVDKHKNVVVGNLNIDTLDASLLVEGALDDLGISVGDLVRDGRGDFESDYLFLNAYYDFDLGTQWSPYVGAGIGNAWVDVSYRPSRVRIIDDDDSVFAWQVMAGLNYLCSEQLTFFGGLRWRETDDIGVRSSLIPANFSLEVENFIVEGGMRWSF